MEITATPLRLRRGARRAIVRGAAGRGGRLGAVGVVRSASLLGLVAAVAALIALAPAFALDPRFPDWPCAQLKVPSLAISSVWHGAAIDPGAPAPAIAAGEAELAARLAARRTPIEEARKLVAGFVAGADEERQAKGQSLFLALYARLNGQREEVMSGIERFSRKQKGAAEGIRERTRDMQKMQDDPGADAAAIDDFAAKIAWETRIFEDRQMTTAAVCEVPVIIEKRLFDLGHAIEDAMRAK